MGTPSLTAVFFYVGVLAIIYLCKECRVMPLSVEQIRELNKVHLYVSSCSDPVGNEETPQNESFVPTSPHVWSMGMFSEGGLQLDSALQDLQPWEFGEKLMKTNVGELASGVLNRYAGIVPQVDYNHFYTYKGTNPLSFSTKCFLVLEEGVDEDFFNPLLRLFFLAYPARGANAMDWVAGKATELKAWADKRRSEAAEKAEKAKKEGKDNKDIRPIEDTFYTIIDKGASGLKEAMGLASDAVESQLGTSYSLHVPPTVKTVNTSSSGRGLDSIEIDGHRVQYYRSNGSGLSVCYGNNYIPNVIITGININIPKLYYHGGFPQVIEVGLSFKTLRVVSANMMYDIVRGRIVQ